MSSSPSPSEETDNRSNKSNKSDNSKKSDKSNQSSNSDDIYKPNKMVTIFVSPGPDHKDGAFLLPHDLAIEASPVFRAAFAGYNWLGKDELSMTLRDVDPETFELLVYYLKHAGLKGLEGVLPQCQALGTPGEAPVKYAKLWMLADLLIMPLLQNNVSTIMQWWMAGVGLDELEDFMHLVYGRDSEYPEGERGILGKMLRFKFYYSQKEELDNCGYEIIPEMMVALKNTNPAFHGFSIDLAVALINSDRAFLGFSPGMMRDLMKRGQVFREDRPELRNALISVGDKIGEYSLARNPGRWWKPGSRTLNGIKKRSPVYVILGPAGMVGSRRSHRNLRSLNKFPFLHSDATAEFNRRFLIHACYRTPPRIARAGIASEVDDLEIFKTPGIAEEPT